MSKGRNSTVISVRLPDVILEAIRKLARGEGISLNEYICGCLKGKIERDLAEKRQSERFSAKARDCSGNLLKIPMSSGRFVVVKESSVKSKRVKPRWLCRNPFFMVFENNAEEKN